MAQPSAPTDSGRCYKVRLLVNAALPYANNSLHLGHIAGAYLGADIFVRYNRMIGNEVMFICGSDEYGTAITIKADQEKVTPSELSERFHLEHRKAFEDLDIRFDLFSRTTNPVHHQTVKEIFLELLNAGYLEKRSMNSPYCHTCKRFMPDRYITGKCPRCGFEEARGDQCENCGKILDPQELIDPKCSVSGDSPEFRETEHLFFKLSNFQQPLLDWLSGKNFWKKNVLEFTRNFVSAGLEDRPVTRDLDWGVDVPVEGFSNKKIYVWFEALLGYISAAKIYSDSKGKPEYWKKFWLDPDTRTYFFMGKDNIIFHTVILPSVLMALGGYNLPYDVPANEWMNYGGKKFSKSKGLGMTVPEALSVADRDYIRYYLASVLPETGDTNFSTEELQERVNTEFISKFGNLVYRLTSFITKNSLEIAKVHDDEFDEVMSYCRDRLSEYREHLGSVEIKKALHAWIDLVQYGNTYMNRSEPWKLIKTDPDRCMSRLYNTLKIVQFATSMIYPFTPSSAKRAWEVLGIRPTVEDSMNWLADDAEFMPVKSDPLFRKIEISDLNPNGLDLRVARIVDVREHPNADKLYLLDLRIGDEERKLVAGLRKYYSREELLGRKIIVVCNLKPARIRGEVSNGMLLAADDGEKVRFLTVDDSVEGGESIQVGGFDYNRSGTIEIEGLAEYGLSVAESGGRIAATAVIDGKRLVLSHRGKPVFPERDIAPGSRIR